MRRVRCRPRQDKIKVLKRKRTKALQTKETHHRTELKLSTTNGNMFSVMLTEMHVSIHPSSYL